MWYKHEILRETLQVQNLSTKKLPFDVRIDRLSGAVAADAISNLFIKNSEIFRVFYLLIFMLIPS